MFEGLISIVLPAFNEGERIGCNILEVAKTLRDFAYHFEIIVVDDGSDDSTDRAVFEASAAVPEVRFVRHVQNQGKGYSLLCGARHAHGDYVVFLDSDLDLHPDQLPLFFETMSAKDADVVIGSKWHPLSNVEVPRLRRLYSKIYYAITRLLFRLPVRDTQTGIKVFKRDALRPVLGRSVCKRFAFDLEALTIINREGFRIVECPVTLTFQRLTNRISLGDVARMVVDTAAIFYRASILRYYNRKPVSVEFLDSIFAPSQEIALATFDQHSSAEETAETDANRKFVAARGL